MEKKSRGLVETWERVQERKQMAEREGIRFVDGIAAVRNQPASQQASTEPTQSVGQQPKTLRKVKLPKPKDNEAENQAHIGLEKEPPFSQRYTRVTTYLENSLNERVKELSRDGRISSVTALVNAALTEFLDKHGIQ